MIETLVSKFHRVLALREELGEEKFLMYLELVKQEAIRLDIMDDFKKMCEILEVKPK